MEIKKALILLGFILGLGGCSGKGGEAIKFEDKGDDPVQTQGEEDNDVPKAMNESDDLPLGRHSTKEMPAREFVIPTEQEFSPNPKYEGIETSNRHIVVAFKEGITGEQFEAAVQATGCELGGTFPLARVVQLICGDGSDMVRFNAVVEQLATMEIVSSAVPDVKMEPTILPPSPPSNRSDPAYVENWIWDTVGLGSNWGLELIGAPAAWNLIPAIKRDMENRTPFQREAGIAIVDEGVYVHPDLDIDIITNNDLLCTLGRSFSVSASCNHGTSVAGIIAAKHNGMWTDGVTPFARIEFHSAVSFVGITAGFSLLSPDIRLVNLSLSTAVTRFELVSQTTAGRVLVSAMGLIMAQKIKAYNIFREVLFISSAANRSGTPLGPQEAQFASPMNWVAVNHEAGKHIIVAEALDSSTTLDGPPVRAGYSNINGGGVFAPANGNAAPIWNGDRETTRLFSGTSCAAPFVTGVAAFLLAIEPTLTNEELRTLLTQIPYADPQDGGPSRTNTRINLFKAALGIDRIRPDRTPKVSHWFADFDDGSPDGNKMFEIGDDNNRGADYEADAQGDGRVDMKDFRRLRDHWLFQDELATDFRVYESTTALLRSGNKKLDFNKNETVERSNDFLSSEELFSIAGMNMDPFVDNRPGIYLDENISDVEIFRRNYADKGDYLNGPDHWPPNTLPNLMRSADLWIRPPDRQALEALGAVGAEVMEIRGDPARGDSPPADLSTLRRRISIPSTAQEVVLTTPLRNYVQVFWQLDCGGGRSNGDAPYVYVPGDLRIAEDRVVKLIPPPRARSCNGTTPAEPAPPGPTPPPPPPAPNPTPPPPAPGGGEPPPPSGFERQDLYTITTTGGGATTTSRCCLFNDRGQFFSEIRMEIPNQPVREFIQPNTASSAQGVSCERSDGGWFVFDLGGSNSWTLNGATATQNCSGPQCIPRNPDRDYRCVELTQEQLRQECRANIDQACSRFTPGPSFDQCAALERQRCDNITGSTVRLVVTPRN